jgi:hypothetical protein
VSIFPGIMMASDIDRDLFTINVIVEPQLNLDLVLIEPMRQPMGPVAETFLKLLENETSRVGARLVQIPPTTHTAGRAIVETRAESRATPDAGGAGRLLRPDRGHVTRSSLGNDSRRRATTRKESA